MKKQVFAVAAATLLIACGSAFAIRSTIGHYRLHLNLNKDGWKALITTLSGIHVDDSQQEIVDKITNHLYRTTRFDGKYISTNNDAERYALTISGQTNNYCSSLSVTLIWTLQQFDIPAREVSFAAPEYLSGASETATHTLVEVIADDKIFLTDPTFNTNYFCESNERLDAKGMISCVAHGKVISWSYLTPPRKGRSIEEYPSSFRHLIYALDATSKAGTFYYASVPEDGWLMRARETVYAKD